MSKQRDAFIALLLSFFHYLEKETNTQLESFEANAGDENYTIFGQWYDQYFGTSGFNGAAWCHEFQTYSAQHVGMTSDQFPFTGSCTTGVNWYIRHGSWHWRDGYKPKIGDTIYFSWTGNFNEGADHVGTVYDFDENFVYTIEGNTGDGTTLIPNGGAVCKKHYPYNYECILGYGTPLFTEDSEDLMSQFIENMATKYGKSTDEVEVALETILKISLHDVAPWETESAHNLVNKGLALQEHDPREIVTFATLGAMEGRRK